MIELKNICKTFSQHIIALDNVSLRVEPGEIYGVIGKSGAGKSTLLRCVNGLERPDAGEVIVDQQSLFILSSRALRTLRHSIGMIFQDFNLLSTRTVYRNVAFPLELQHHPKAYITKTIMPLIEWVGLGDRLHAYPHELSGGQKQRVAIARALATHPKILLCDEMTSALDPQTTQSILTLIKEINTRLHLTIMLITHEMQVIKSICDKVAVMDQGRIVEQGEVVSVFAQPKHPMTRELTSATFHMKLPTVLESAVQSDLTSDIIAAGYALWRFTFVGAATGEPLISELIRQFDLDINILQAHIELLQGHSVGMMLVAITFKGHAEKYHQALQHIKTLSLTIGLTVTVEVIGYVNRNAWHFN